MKKTRNASGLHIVCLAICLIVLINGMLLIIPIGKPHNSPAHEALIFFPEYSPAYNNLAYLAGATQTFENQSSRFAQLNWMHQRIWENWNSNAELIVTLEQGLLYRETLYFNRIEPEPIQIAVEDYDPANSPFEDYIWTDEESYMSFRINGTEPVRVDGFWIYLRGPTQGIFRYRVYGAEPGTSADTFVDTSAPLTDWIEVPISPTLEPGDEYWFWVDTNESTLILHPLETYDHTFYFGLARAFEATTDTRINWVYCRDDVIPDEDDEGDCYGRFSSWSYRTRDLFLNVSILPVNLELYPTDIDMQVNGLVVTNLSSPSKGIWDSGEYQPPLSLNGAVIGYQMTVNWPDYYQWVVGFDVRWIGYFLDSIPVQAGFLPGSVEANWLLTIIVDFPTDITNQTIHLSVHPEWSIEWLTRNTVLYTNWVVDDEVLIINNAEDGLWQVFCLVPISPLTLYSGIFVWLAVILVMLLFALFIFYRQQILLPRQRIRRRHLQALADTFYDINKIKRILLIHKETGLCLLDPIVDRKMKANLVSALIQAITTFGVSLTESEGSSEPLDDTSSLRQITYHDFHIIVHDGQYTRNALIFRQPPNSELDKRLEEFTKRFEEQYQDVLENWAGRLNIFNEAVPLVDEYLFISLRLPHTLHTGQVSRFLLSQPERTLYALAKTLTLSNGSFFIRELVDKYLQDKGVQRIEVFEALFNLREKGLIVPIQTDFPYEFTNNATA